MPLVLELIKVSQQKAGYQSFVDDKDDDSNSDKDEKDDDFNSPCNGGVCRDKDKDNINDKDKDKDGKDDDFNSPCNGGVDLARPV